MFYSLRYIEHGDGLCPDDMKNREKEALINLTCIESVFAPKEFGYGSCNAKYVKVKMSASEDMYFISEAEGQKLRSAIQSMKQS